jgi:hypothetical protein
MTIALQLFGIALVALLDFGPLGRQTLPFISLMAGPVFIWAVTWFGHQRDAFRSAILLGIVYGLISFLPPILWLTIFFGAYLIVEWLRGRYFDASSFLLALLTLGIVSVWAYLILGIATQSVDLVVLVGGVVANVLGGAILYYFVGTRFKFLQRWAGRRL